MTKEEASKLIYNELDYAYCDNCRNSESEGYNDNCDECHRKYNNWAVSKEVCDELAEKILEQ